MLSRGLVLHSLANKGCGSQALLEVMALGVFCRWPTLGPRRNPEKTNSWELSAPRQVANQVAEQIFFVGVVLRNECRVGALTPIL